MDGKDIVLEESEESTEILKPSVSSLDIIREREHSKNNNLSKRVEEYNYKQGMEKVYKTTQTNEYNDVYSDTVVNIRPPRKRLNLVPIFAIIILIGIVYLAYYYSTNYMKKPIIQSEPPVIEDPVEPEIPQSTESNVVCKKNISNGNGIRTEFEYQFIGEQDKLKQYIYSYRHVFESLPSDAYIKSCNNINSIYKSYEGFSYNCTKLDDYNYEYRRVINLEMLDSKELTFKNGNGETKEFIKEDLDSSIEEVVNRYIDDGYECEKNE